MTVLRDTRTPTLHRFLEEKEGERGTGGEGALQNSEG